MYEKSHAVQWVSVKKPEKRKAKIRMAESDPHFIDLYQANLLDNFYPNRPAALSHVCLYDFVKWYHRGDNDAEHR